MKKLVYKKEKIIFKVKNVSESKIFKNQFIKVKGWDMKDYCYTVEGVDEEDVLCLGKALRSIDRMSIGKSYKKINTASLRNYYWYEKIIIKLKNMLQN